MKTYTFEVPAALSEAIEARQLELEGYKDLLGYAYSTTQYVIPEARIALLEEKMMKCKAEYEILKQQVDSMIPTDINKIGANWNLDFATHIVTVVYND